MKAEKVARRSCAVVFPMEFDYRRLRKAFLQSIGVNSGFVDMPNFPDPRPLAIWLSDTGRQYEVKRFETTVECPESVFEAAMVRDSVMRGADPDASEAMAERFVSGLSRGGLVRYKFSTNVVAWNVNDG